MKFPVQIGADKSGLEVPASVCPVCRGALSGEPGEFAFLNGGALQSFGDGSAGMAPGLEAFLSIGLHGNHSAGANGPSGFVSLVEDAPLGQYEFYFCSTKCLRGFLNQAVDELEKGIAHNAG